MKKKISLSETEWRIMRILWNDKKATVKEVWSSLYPKKEKAYTTVQTTMDRLVEKNFLAKEKIGLVNFYQPLISEKKALTQATENLVSRAFQGSFGLLAAHLIDSPQFEASDLKKIKELIKQKEEEEKP
ncbi:MAG: BlaI/MecI/CopY family transcriptional regulator [Candidatus Aminicenantes bacterium]|nr:BlaI/MecI/CopY family transcriptional regulator [Candidatus Aminicenantes bacterium]